MGKSCCLFLFPWLRQLTFDTCFAGVRVICALTCTPARFVFNHVFSWQSYSHTQFYLRFDWTLTSPTRNVTMIASAYPARPQAHVTGVSCNVFADKLYTPTTNKSSCRLHKQPVASQAGMSVFFWQQRATLLLCFCWQHALKATAWQLMLLPLVARYLSSILLFRCASLSEPTPTASDWRSHVVTAAELALHDR